ncbi:hypothetical protein GCM10011607_28350 [Shewanella inventionis]|uniref:Uncharacterized protein n=1 Tax=Shewanella inventionis TaxID=1738770 RepID=A0ABQ1JGH5_9GAMM|nr:hypothetical protein GCM10011607_28350 [Shewanella inventionis]
MDYMIKSFNNRINCTSPDEVIDTLASQFRGQHVTVIKTLCSGIRQAHFVTVLSSGVLLDSYKLTPFEIEG